MSSSSNQFGAAGAYPVTCPRCGAPTAPGSACQFCGAPLAGRGQPPDRPVPPLPLEYAGLTRPRVSRSINGGGCFLIGFGIFWTVFSSFFMIIAISTAVRDQQTYTLLSQEGRVVPGVITMLEVDDSGDTTDYTVSYRYSAPLGDTPRVYNQHQSVSPSLFETFEIGGAAPVVYAVSQPGVSRLQVAFGPPDRWGPLLMGGMGLLFVGIGLALLAGAISSLYEYIRLRRTGQEINATVFDAWEDKDSDGDRTYQVAYGFKAAMPDGTLRLVTRAETHRQAYFAVHKGSIIQVRYVPDDPEISQIIHFG